MTAPDPSTVQPEQTQKRLLLGIAVGHALEWYDWGIYAIFVPFFATQFFDPAHAASAVLSSLAVFAVGFVARPVGGFVVGRLADRLGLFPHFRHPRCRRLGGPAARAGRAGVVHGR